MSMITLHKFSPVWGLPDISPFCIKVETYLRMAGLSYRSVVSAPSKAPKGTLPFIEHNGITIGDSSAIITHFEHISPNPIDKVLDQQQQAISLAFKSMVEEHLYFVGLWTRWVDLRGWQIYKPAICHLSQQIGFPSFSLQLVAAMMRRHYIKKAYFQGIGRHSREEIAAIGIEHLHAISVWLDRKPFFLGEDPHIVDATIYAFLASILWAPFEGAVQAEMESLSNLTAYCERIKTKYWLDYVQPYL